jgi:hypothetical protein
MESCCLLQRRKRQLGGKIEKVSVFCKIRFFLLHGHVNEKREMEGLLLFIMER